MIKKILLAVFEPYTDLPWKTFGNVLLWSLKLFSLILVPYFAVIITGLVFMLLIGEGILYGVLNFTRAYFYDGVFLFTAWRVHLVIFIICIFICINEELK